MKNTKKITSAAAAAALGLLLAGCNTSAPQADINDNGMMDSTSDAVMSSAPAAMDSGMTGDDAMMAADYKDGTYSAVGVYRSPAGGEQVDVTLTLKDGVVTDATFQGEATNPKSVMLQGKFGEGFKEEVVGKNIDELSLSVVNGSSLTPLGFMDAVEKIKAEAKA